MQEFINHNGTNIRAFTEAMEDEDLTKKLDALKSDMESIKFKEVSRKKIGRNQPCPCLSGKKFKRCHGSGN